MEVYIKPMKKAKVVEKKEIYLKDVSEVYAPNGLQTEIENIHLLSIESEKIEGYLISVLDITKKIVENFDNIVVVNIGETDTYIEYLPKKHVEIGVLKISLIVFVCMILFAGSSIAIMSFYTDAQIYTIFEKSNELFFGTKEKRPLLFEIPYAIGLMVGIIGFFNHFLGKKITNDPTPIEVQISDYESQVSDTMIDILERRKKRGE